jgi:hypothetical protein
MRARSTSARVPQDTEDQLPGGGGRADPFLQGAELTAFPPRAFFDQVLEEAPVTVRQSDIRALIRGELRALRGDVTGALGRAPNEMTERHLRNVLTRIERILEGAHDDAG